MAQFYRTSIKLGECKFYYLISRLLRLLTTMFYSELIDVCFCKQFANSIILFIPHKISCVYHSILWHIITSPNGKFFGEGSEINDERYVAVKMELKTMLLINCVFVGPVWFSCSEGRGAIRVV